MTEPDPLPDDLLDYLAAAREPEPVSAALAERLLARLGPLLPPDGGGGSPSPEGDGGPPAAGSGGPSTAASGAETASTATASATTGLLQGKLAVAVVAATIGAAGGATGYATFGPSRTVVVQTYPEPARATASPGPTSSRASAPVAEPPAAVAEPPSARAPTTTRASEPPAPRPSGPNDAPAQRKSTMRAERILLEAANAALIRGDHAAAIDSLDKHARRYPHGELAQERDILLTQAKKRKAAGLPKAPK